MAYVFKVCGIKLFNTDFIPHKTLDYIRKWGGDVWADEVFNYEVLDIDPFLDVLQMDYQEYLKQDKQKTLVKNLNSFFDKKVMDAVGWRTLENVTDDYITNNPLFRLYCVIKEIKSISRWDENKLCYRPIKKTPVIVNGYNYS